MSLPSLRPYVRGAGRALVAGVLLSAAAAAAQPTEASPVAQALFQQARELLKQERYAEACPKLAESERLEPKLGTLLNLALCEEKLGRTATAWAHYTSGAAIARREGQKEREDFARERIADLEKHLALVTLQIGARAPGLRILLDDQPLADAVLGTPLPIDPGRHQLTATAPGKKAWSQTIEVPADRAELRVPIPALEAVPVEVPAPTPPPAPVVVPPPLVPSAVPVPVATPSAARSNGRALAYAGFSIGAAGVITGSITGVITLARAGDIRGQCPGDKCGVDQQAPIRSATMLANVSNASFVIGAVGLGAGIAGVIWARSGDAEGRPAVSVTPIVGPGVVGLRGIF